MCLWPLSGVYKLHTQKAAATAEAAATQRLFGREGEAPAEATIRCSICDRSDFREYEWLASCPEPRTRNLRTVLHGYGHDVCKDCYKKHAFSAEARDEFKVEIRKVEGQSWGITYSTGDHHSLVIQTIDWIGAVSEWNDMHPALQMRVGDEFRVVYEDRDVVKVRVRRPEVLKRSFPEVLKQDVAKQNKQVQRLPWWQRLRQSVGQKRQSVGQKKFIRSAKGVLPSSEV